MIIILILCGNQPVKKMKFQQVRCQVIMNLSGKEMVIREKRTMDITFLSGFGIWMR